MLGSTKFIWNKKMES